MGAVFAVDRTLCGVGCAHVIQFLVAEGSLCLGVLVVNIVSRIFIKCYLYITHMHVRMHIHMHRTVSFA